MKIITNIGLKLLIPAMLTAFSSQASIASDAKYSGSGSKGSENKTAGGFSHDKYADVLRKYVNNKGLVDYKRHSVDRILLDEYLDQIAELDQARFKKLSENDQIAFLINAYNAITLRSIIDNYPIKASGLSSLRFPRNSIRQIDGVWNEKKHKVFGQYLTLDDIEHRYLRANYNEPRIHMALVCASIGCPLLRNEPYTGPKLDAQLTDQTVKFLEIKQNFRIIQDDNKVYISSIFKWFGEDFVSDYSPAAGFKGNEAERASLNFISKHIISSEADFLKNGKYKVKYLDYDWELNEQ